jgi:hypothetical protein
MEKCADEGEDGLCEERNRGRSDDAWRVRGGREADAGEEGNVGVVGEGVWYPARVRECDDALFEPVFGLKSARRSGSTASRLKLASAISECSSPSMMTGSNHCFDLVDEPLLRMASWTWSVKWSVGSSRADVSPSNSRSDFRCPFVAALPSVLSSRGFEMRSAWRKLWFT